MAAVNARSVAKALNCSTQPIFSYFRHGRFEECARSEGARRQQTISEDAKDGNTVESRCSAYVRFATEQPRLFAHMFLRENDQTFGSEVVREPLVSAETEERAGRRKGEADLHSRCSTRARHGAMQATGRTAFTRQQIEANMHAMHEMMLAQTK
ncbi:MAG: hypothetical protein ACLUI3_12410 [Christensenellales bacterium]